MERNKTPIAGANIRVSAPHPFAWMNTWMYFSGNYEFPYAPKAIKNLSFDSTMAVFACQNNLIRGTIPLATERNIDLKFEVTGIDYGTIEEQLLRKRLRTISLEEYVKRGMPKEI